MRNIKLYFDDVVRELFCDDLYKSVNNELAQGGKIESAKISFKLFIKLDTAPLLK